MGHELVAVNSGKKAVNVFDDFAVTCSSLFPHHQMGIFKEGKKSHKGSEEHLSSGLLLVTLDAAKSLPVSR